MANPARYDLRQMSSLQKELHKPKEDAEYWNNCFADIFEPVARNASSTVSFKSVKSNKGTVDYTIDDNLDYLDYSYLVQEIPPVKVAPEYQDTIEIKWPDFPGINLFKYAVLKSDDIAVNTLSPIGIYNYMKFIMEPRMFDKYLKLIGHRSNLTTWSKELPSDELYVMLPWFYAIHPSKALPIFLLKDREKIIHRFEFNSIEKLLRMRQRIPDSNEWKEIPFNLNYITMNMTNDKYLPTPEMFARMSLVDEEDKEEIRCQAKDQGGIYQRFIDDFVVIPSTEEFQEGQAGTIQLNHDAPCKAISFLAVNTQAHKLNNYCNFTDNLEDVSEGAWPILNYSLNYGSVSRIPETPIKRVEMEALYCMQNNINHDGMAMHCFDLRPNFLEACSGPVFKQLNAVFKVQFKEPSSNSPPQRYTLVVVLWVTKKLLLKMDEKDPQYYNVFIEPDISMKI